MAGVSAVPVDCCGVLDLGHRLCAADIYGHPYDLAPGRGVGVLPPGGGGGHHERKWGDASFCAPTEVINMDEF